MYIRNTDQFSLDTSSCNCISEQINKAQPVRLYRAYIAKYTRSEANIYIPKKGLGYMHTTLLVAIQEYMYKNLVL